MKKEEVNKILGEIETGYDSMSGKFSETRKYFWRGLEFIGDYAKNGDKILDYGCGNGRLLELLTDKDIEYVGVDVSQKLINIAKEKYHAENIEFHKISSSRSLSFPDNYFNAVYSIAVFHHIPGEKERKRVVKELYRVVAPGGYIVATVWNLWQKKYSDNIFKNWINKIFRRGKLDWNDCHVSFKNNKGKIFNRYHHAFLFDEMEELFSSAGFKIEKCEIINNRNIVLIGKK
ncbi:class I SAM-dependent methyltransferase [Patescibacteria group bacterium]